MSTAQTLLPPSLHAQEEKKYILPTFMQKNFLASIYMA